MANVATLTDPTRMSLRKDGPILNKAHLNIRGRVRVFFEGEAFNVLPESLLKELKNRVSGFTAPMRAVTKMELIKFNQVVVVILARASHATLKKIAALEFPVVLKSANEELTKFPSS